MRYAADLHLHSRHAKAVSPDMTLETIARYARRKGMDVMGTGDILQPAWLRELEEKLAPAEPGWFALRPDVDGGILDALPPSLRKPLRFVLSTEVNCAPAGSGELQGLHHLLFFPSFAAVRAFRERVEPHGNLDDGRPTLRISSRELLALAGGIEGCRFAPAHVMNPYFSSLGSQMRHRTLEEIFGAEASRLTAVEMGLTSIPPMCRRIASLDPHALFANSDAHSPENIGRECTILESEPGYEPMFSALHAGSPERLAGCLKFSIHRTRYFLNWCPRCAVAYDEPDCPRGHGRLAVGSRDWLERIATRAEPSRPRGTPRFRMYVPLRQLLREFLQVGPSSRKPGDLQEQLLRRLGSERDILTKLPGEEIAEASSPALARVIVAQRTANPLTRIVIETPGEQPSLL